MQRSVPRASPAEKKRSLPALIVTGLVCSALVAGLHAGWGVLTDTADEIQYRTASVERGPIVSAVSAPGVVNAVLTVHVAAQTPGRIVEMHADYNSEVRRGQILARIDPEPHEWRTAQAQADLDAARAALATARSGLSAQHARIAQLRVASLDAEREMERKARLAERGFVAAVEADRAAAAHRDAQAEIVAAEAQLAHQEAQVESALASVRQRERAVAHARAERERTYVRAPVDSVVISRSAETGQVVDASNPTELFTLARDLREMQVEVAVAEADVGKLRPGQAAVFTVEAFPRRTFEGRVTQVRKAPQRVNDGVAYTALITAPNPDLALLPGMNARVRIAIATRPDALRVPNAALAFRAEEGALALSLTSRVWRLDEASNRPVPVEVQAGVSDGAYTEILSGNLREGDTLVLGAAIGLPRAASAR